MDPEECMPSELIKCPLSSSAIAKLLIIRGRKGKK